MTDGETSRVDVRSRLVLGSLALALAVSGCAGDTAEPIPRVTQPTDVPSQPTPSEPTSEPTDTGDANGGNRDPEAVGTLVEGLEVPWGVDFLPDGSAVVTERISGRVLNITADGRVGRLGTVDTAVAQGEAGLLGVAVSPDFETDRTVFLYLTTDTDNRVVRARLEGSSLGSTSVVLDGIPAGFIHDGGRIAFGPDGHLYVTTGETGDPELAQDPDSLAGKILRITADGEPAPGNPDPDSPVWSLGHRNVQGLAWDDEDRLWASEFGASEWDELNLIEKGGNYGWPRVEGTGGGQGLIDPQVVWPVEQASPSGLAYVDGHLWMAGLRGQRLWRIRVSAAGKASQPKAYFTEDYGRLRTVATAPDGLLWLTTSNRDGRGTPAPADDRIIQVRP
ncbi:PQQ-dependent sugar dehydrogenase [Nocardioides ganghwensis]|uniref:PQQ-dependent sugar dehydrogenase n=1 Tax=Nocardioides ganghwensis TaxID=252230 RepID=A0A4Q2S7C0_9ACTN|nr:PQQ-dependent sugar dehydrogenase [Nocardioides ganghwensis]MBD3947619.1 PQQ-dependent sugar dehydrogenase [Nocardioides ganghwensis]RYB98441.1 PQQ-dependent sugar dehydrogenase [Nocardioides ganghwensis]